MLPAAHTRACRSGQAYREIGGVQAPAIPAASAHATLSRVRSCRADRALDQRSNRSKIASGRVASPAAARWLKFSGAGGGEGVRHGQQERQPEGRRHLDIRLAGEPDDDGDHGKGTVVVKAFRDSAVKLLP